MPTKNLEVTYSEIMVLTEAVNRMEVFVNTWITDATITKECLRNLKEKLNKIK